MWTWTWTCTYHLLQLQPVCLNNKHSCFVFFAHSATSLLFLKCQSSSSSFRLSFDHLACVLNDKPHSPEPSIQFYRVLCFQPLPTLVQNPHQVVFVHSSAMSFGFAFGFLLFLPCFSYSLFAEVSGCSLKRCPMNFILFWWRDSILGLLIDFRFTGNRFWNLKPVSKYRYR